MNLGLQFPNPKADPKTAEERKARLDEIDSWLEENEPEQP